MSSMEIQWSDVTGCGGMTTTGLGCIHARTKGLIHRMEDDTRNKARYRRIKRDRLSTVFTTGFMCLIFRFNFSACRRVCRFCSPGEGSSSLRWGSLPVRFRVIFAKEERGRMPRDGSGFVFSLYSRHAVQSGFFRVQ